MEQTRENGYVLLLEGLAYSEGDTCERALREDGVRYESVTHGDPRELPRQHFDLSTDLWVHPDDLSRESLKDKKGLGGDGRLGERFVTGGPA